MTAILIFIRFLSFNAKNSNKCLPQGAERPLSENHPIQKQILAEGVWGRSESPQSESPPILQSSEDNPLELYGFSL
jgi:hypothetical protein